MAKVTLQIDVNDENSFENFLEKMHENGLTGRYGLAQIVAPEYTFREEFLNHIAEHGLSSLFNFSIVMEDITSPSMNINDIEAVIKAFVQRLAPTKKLVVIDPYFYAENTAKDTHQLFARLIAPLLPDLEELIVISNNPSGPMQSLMHAEIKSLSGGIKIKDHKSSAFHDRFWINPSDDKGIVIGTSLNGIGKKIALVDKLAANDVAEITSQIGVQGIVL